MPRALAASRDRRVLQGIGGGARPKWPGLDRPRQPAQEVAGQRGALRARLRHHPDQEGRHTTNRLRRIALE
eukprot:9039668-Lingulodinium_polyedra.AAC.1